MKIEFTKKWRFSHNGHSFVEYCKGWAGEVSESCGESALQEDVAVEVVERKVEQAGQKSGAASDQEKAEKTEKAEPGPEKNKSLGAAPENK